MTHKNRLVSILLYRSSTDYLNCDGKRKTFYLTLLITLIWQLTAAQEFLQLDYGTRKAEITAVYQTERGLYYLREAGYSTDVVFHDNEHNIEVIYSRPWTKFKSDFHMVGDTVEIYLSYFLDYDVVYHGHILIKHTSESTFVEDSATILNASTSYGLIKKLPNNQILAQTGLDNFEIVNQQGESQDTIDCPFANCYKCLNFEGEYFYSNTWDARIFRFDSTFHLVHTAESAITDLKRLTTGNFALVLSDRIEIYDHMMDSLLGEINFPDGFEYMSDMVYLNGYYYIGIFEGERNSIYSFSEEEGWKKAYTFPCQYIQNSFITTTKDALFLVSHQRQAEHPSALLQVLNPFNDPNYRTIDLALENVKIVEAGKRFNDYLYDLSFEITNLGVDTIENFAMYSEDLSTRRGDQAIEYFDSVAIAPGETRVIQHRYEAFRFTIEGNALLYIPGANGTLVNDCGSDVQMTEIVTSSSQFSESDLQIFPNPAKNHLVIQSPFLTKAELIVSDMGGNKLHQQEMSDMANLDVTDLSPGIYLVIVKKEEELVMRKLMVSR